MPMALTCGRDNNRALSEINLNAVIVSIDASIDEKLSIHSQFDKRTIRQNNRYALLPLRVNRLPLLNRRSVSGFCNHCGIGR